MGTDELGFASTGTGQPGLDQAFLSLVQRAMLPVVGRLSTLEAELRGIRNALEEAKCGASGNSSVEVSQKASDADRIKMTQDTRNFGQRCAAPASAAPPTAAMPAGAQVASAASGGGRGATRRSGRATASSAAATAGQAVEGRDDVDHEAAVLYEPGTGRGRAPAVLPSGGAVPPQQRHASDPAQGLTPPRPCEDAPEEAEMLQPGSGSSQPPQPDEADAFWQPKDALHATHRLQDIHRESPDRRGQHPVRQESSNSTPEATNSSQAVSSAGPSGVLAHAAVFFDFDSTLTTPRYLDRAKDYALADRPALCQSMTRPEILANFGGPGRVARLHALLQRLSARGVALFIISLGYTEAIRHQLGAIGLGRFFPQGHVFGQDAADLVQAKHRKAVLIRRLMDLNGWSEECVLFVDDDESHIGFCVEHGICRTMRVRGPGLALEEIECIEATASQWTPPARPPS